MKNSISLTPERRVEMIQTISRAPLEDGFEADYDFESMSDHDIKELYYGAVEALEANY